VAGAAGQPDDAAWKENLIGMGSAPNVPKLFHNNGKVTPASRYASGNKPELLPSACPQ